MYDEWMEYIPVIGDILQKCLHCGMKIKLKDVWCFYCGKNVRIHT